jgi:hypothetical protein
MHVRHDAGTKMARDTGQALAADIYFEDERAGDQRPKLLTKDEARRIAANVAKLPDDDLDELAARVPFSVGFRARRARAARWRSLFDIRTRRRAPAIS